MYTYFVDLFICIYCAVYIYKLIYTHIVQCNIYSPAHLRTYTHLPMHIYIHEFQFSPILPISNTHSIHFPQRVQVLTVLPDGRLEIVTYRELATVGQFVRERFLAGRNVFRVVLCGEVLAHLKQPIRHHLLDVKMLSLSYL